MSGWLAQHAVTVAVLAMTVWLLCGWKRLSPAARHALWLLVLLKFCTPPWLVWPWEAPFVIDWNATTVSAPVEASPVTTEPAVAVLPSLPPPETSDLKPPQETAPINADVPARLPVAPPISAPSRGTSAPVPANPFWKQVPWTLVLGWFWAGSATVVLLGQAVRLARWHRKLAKGEPAPAWLTEELKACAARLGVNPPTAFVVPGSGSPFLWCLGAPRLIIPAELLTQLSRAVWPGVLVHELAHLRRRDHWVSWLVLVAGCVWWWHPFFWLVRRQLRQHADFACDAWVLHELPSQRRAYAETLLDVTRLYASSALPWPAMAMASAALRRSFRRRLHMIMREQVNCRLPRLALAGLGLLALVILPGWSGSAPEDGKGQPVMMVKPKELPLEEALKKASVNGKYQMLLAQIKVDSDAAKYKDFHDLGAKSDKSYAGHDNLPKGHWVYVYPYWYIWRDQTAVASKLPKRAWGPEQMVGEPDTPEAGDQQSAWASRLEDAPDEWLLLEYATPVIPKAVMIHANYNPGSVIRVTAFRLDGTEVEVWKGADPTSPEEQKGISFIPVKIDFKTNRIKVYLDSVAVPGWNEIDAVGLTDTDGKTHWVTAADCGTTYARPYEEVMAQRVPTPVLMPENAEIRLKKLEAEVDELKKANKELREQLKGVMDKMKKE
jgi:beta-lactamase regulating signal transducer with metallopeptidase domain